MAHRYFLTSTDGTTATVTGPEAAHLVKVMRIKEGDTVEIYGLEFNYVE